MASARETRAEQLIFALSRSKATYAREFLNARTKGTEIGGGRATVEDAKAAARVNLAAAKIEDPEIIRWRLTALLGGAPPSGDE